MEGFKELQFRIIPRRENYEDDALALLASMFQVPENQNEHYLIEFRHRPSIPDNVDHWQVFEDDEQINKFLQRSGEFGNIKIDQENMYEGEASAEPDPTYYPFPKEY